MKKKGIIILLIFVSLISCKKILDSADSLTKDNVKITDLKAVRVNNQYALSIPSYMKEMKSLHDDASFEYANLIKETYSIVIDEDKQSFIDIFKEAEAYDDTKSALENYTEIQLENFGETIIDLKVKPIVSNKKSSKQYELFGKVDQYKIAYLVRFIESKDDMYMIMSWTLDNRYQKYKNTFKLIQESFKLL